MAGEILSNSRVNLAKAMATENAQPRMMEAATKFPFDRSVLSLKLPRLPASRTPQPNAPVPVPAAPAGAVNNPFSELPFPSAGDRIKSDDIKKLSQSLRILYDACMLSSVLQAHTFGEARLALKSQQYQIQQVITVFGTVLENPDDASLDARKVLQVIPVELGQRQVTVIVTEAVETRRFAPNLLGLTYRDAAERLRLLAGDMIQGIPARPVPQVTGMTLGQAREQLLQ